MKKQSNKLLWALALITLVLILPQPPALADDLEAGDTGYYTLQDTDGNILATYAGVISVDDEYIASDNQRYRVSVVDTQARRAVAQWVETVELPQVDMPAAQQDWVPKIAIYCTHSDESYVPASGTESKDNGGDILDVAQSLADQLNNMGCEAIADDSNHVPHDAGAYRRSRKTAVALMKEIQPTLLLDVHRDGIPDPDEYTEEVDGEAITKVRVVIGRGNQNKDANEEVALQLKAVADKLYPGFIKDIYLGKGSYNQDLMPRSILLEFGTHGNDKDQVLASTEYMAKIISTTLGAGSGQNATASAIQSVTGQTSSANQSPNATDRTTTATVIQGQPQAGNTPGEGGGSWSSIATILLVLAGLGIVTLLVFSRGGKSRAGRFFRELTGTGHRQDDDSSGPET